MSQIEADLEEGRALKEEAQVKIMEAKAKKITAEAAIEAAEHAREESRRQRRLADAEIQRQVQLEEARQVTKLEADVASGAISKEAAERLCPLRIKISLERYVAECLGGDLAAFRKKLVALKKTEASVASELGRKAKASFLNRVRFLGKARGDYEGTRVMWYEEDSDDLFQTLKEIVEAWTALPSGQMTLRVG